MMLGRAAAIRCIVFRVNGVIRKRSDNRVDLLLSPPALLQHTKVRTAHLLRCSGSGPLRRSCEARAD